MYSQILCDQCANSGTFGRLRSKKEMNSAASSVAASAASVRSRVAFFEQFKDVNADDVSSCGKRAREVESITSPGMVRQVKEKLMSPESGKSKPGAEQGGAMQVSPGKVRQSVETITNLSRHSDTENTPPSKKPRISAAELVVRDLAVAGSRASSADIASPEKKLVHT